VRSTVLQLENTSSDAAVRIERIETPDDAFRVHGEFPLRVPPGSTRFVDLHFRPDAAGDRSSPIRIVTDDARWAPVRLEAIAVAVEPPETRADPGPVDLVLVLDVSTTMGTMPRLREAVVGLFDFIESDGLDVRIGLVSFVNDVLVHESGAFVDRTTFLRELDGQFDPQTGAPNLDLPRHQLNFDFPENSLGALYRAATEFPFRRDARRALLLVTDGSYLEPPAVFSDGTPAVSLAQTGSALEDRGIRLVAIQASASGRGLSASSDGEPSLVSRSGGTWVELADVASGDPAFGEVLIDIAGGLRCAQRSAEWDVGAASAPIRALIAASTRRQCSGKSTSSGSSGSAAKASVRTAAVIPCASARRGHALTASGHTASSARP
jgi:hypothetical protein